MVFVPMPPLRHISTHGQDLQSPHTSYHHTTILCNCRQHTLSFQRFTPSSLTLPSFHLALLSFAKRRVYGHYVSQNSLSSPFASRSETRVRSYFRSHCSSHCSSRSCPSTIGHCQHAKFCAGLILFSALCPSSYS